MTSAAVLDSVASSSEFLPASIQIRLPSRFSYQRNEKPGGGNSSDLASENDIGATISTGRHRKISTSTRENAQPQIGDPAARRHW